jgi:aminopeptidase N
MNLLYTCLFAGIFSIGLSAQNLHHNNPTVTDERAWPGVETLAGNERSDTIDVLHYYIYLDITNIAGSTIAGYTTVTFTPRMNSVNELCLDLLGLNVDSIKIGSTLLTYTYDDTLIKMTLPATMNIGDTTDVTVWYNGQPQSDASWGGFYFQNGYAYNLGVGFDANPHVFGRVWHPCFDNFVERATYTQTIGSNGGKIAYCNGDLINDTTDGNGVRWRTWDMTDPIPSYLACVAVYTYTQVNWTYNGTNGAIPITLVAAPADTNNTKNSFVNLKRAIGAYDTLFYPFMWQHVGYIFVPFNAGAMEHATAIGYPRSFANGSLTYQDIMAHELSHHWFGDLATCRTQEDMWLNEGWAVFCEYIFNEWVYGRSQYDAMVAAQQDAAVHYFHHSEGLLKLDSIPFTYTYGNHVYLKGSLMAHTLRGYVGDSAFFNGVRYHLSQNEFKDVSSVDFRNNLFASSGMSCVNDFFNDCISQPGWSDFVIDSTVTVPNGPNFDVTVYLQQKLLGATNYYNNVPLEIAFLNTDLSATNQRFYLSGQYDTVTITLPYNPFTVIVDPKNLIADAESDEEKLITATGSNNYALGRVNFTVTNCPDTAYLRVEHHWVAPDPIQNNVNNYRLSTLRYWEISGLWPAGFVTKARFTYDGRTAATSGGANWLDQDLTIPNGDSIILVYRANAADDWHEWPYYTKTIQGPVTTSKFGYVVADSIQPGEYAFANGVSTVIGIAEHADEEHALIEIYPVPSDEGFQIQTNNSVSGPVTVLIHDMEGRIVYNAEHTDHNFYIPTKAWSQGLYIVELRQNEKLLQQEKITVYH